MTKAGVKKAHFVSLGCARNLVDSEIAAGLLGSGGWALTAFPKEADAVVINTCAFTREARDESNNEIEHLSKQISRSAKFVVCGCLGQKEKAKLFKKFPRIDAVVGSSDYRHIDDILKRIVSRHEKPPAHRAPLDTIRREHLLCVGKPDFIADSSFPRLLSTPASYAYIKIAEGCSNHCSYCAIPALRGEFRSRSIKDILTEAENVAAMGVKELILIANDTAFYGGDATGGKLGRLLEKLHVIKPVKRIRILYMHPAHIGDSLIKKIASLPKVARYFDIPVQHTDDFILKRMNRPAFRKTQRLIENIRKYMPDAAVRSTFITGFPGETGKRFGNLAENLKKIKFSWVGVFNYSPEKGTPSFKMGGRASVAEALRRAEKLMEIQQEISFDFVRSFVGKKLEIIADSSFKGRTYFQAPDVDGEVLFKEKQLPGSLKKMKIISSKGYDLIA
ncbi:MAG: 30S ribosomal protein S12 methylthiotransferase RimO [Elusimicrobiota bacterium]|nr:30S ribosomal protein S12 methylthiotransferase RimO [Elusimicrobiota bacterium]